MPTASEGRYLSDFLTVEQGGQLSRNVVQLAPGSGTLLAGMVLARLISSGLYVPAGTAGSNGETDARAILAESVVLGGQPVRAVVVDMGPAEVGMANLLFGATIETLEERRAAVRSLYANTGIRVSEAADGPTAEGVVPPPPPPLPAVSVSVTGSMVEGGTMTVTITASATSAVPMSVNGAVSGIGANPLNAADFGGTFPSWTSITIAPGDLVATRTFAATDDSDVEPDETGRVTISAPVNCTIAGATADFSVLNNDIAPPEPGGLLVTVEGNGWVLDVRGTWGASTFASFDVDGDAVLPKVGLNLTGAPGFTRSGGEAVATTWDRGAAIVATDVLRQPAPPVGESTADIPVLDEVDNGDGTRTVKLALSARVFAGETVTVDFLAGWRTGMPAALAVAAVNNSTVQPIAPISRWAVENLRLTEGTTLVPVERIIASHYPRHFGGALHQAVAGVRFRATDGTNWTPWQWTTAPSVSPLHSDNLKCWRVDLDCTGLTAGVITVVAEEYPWIGSVKTIGSAHVTDANHTRNPLPNLGLHACYDPTGSRYGALKRFVYVDAATGSTTPDANMVYATGAAARAGNRAASASVAMQAMYLANITLPAANGFPGGARSADWWEIWLAPGVQPVGTFSVTTGFTAKEGFLVIRGDPDDANPSESCVLRSHSAVPTLRNLRWYLKDVTAEIGEAALLGAGNVAGVLVTDNHRLRAKPGFETSSTGYFSGTENLNETLVTHLRTIQRNTGTGPVSAWRVALARNCDFGRTMRAHTVINCVQNFDADFAYTSSGNNPAFQGFSIVGVTDQMFWNIRQFRGNGPFFNNPIDNGGSVNQINNPAVTTRFAVVNALCEGANLTTTGVSKGFKVGEGVYQSWFDSIIEHATVIGRRSSIHNDPPDNTVGTNVATGNVMRNGYYDRLTSKKDTFGSPPHGSRTGMWQVHWNVGWYANYDGNRAAIGADAFPWEYFGRNSLRDLTGTPGVASTALFVNDQSNMSPAATNPGVNGVGDGLGDYRVLAGSPLIGRGGVANIDVDIVGVARPAAPTSGAYEFVA